MKSNSDIEQKIAASCKEIRVLIKFSAIIAIIAGGVYSLPVLINFFYTSSIKAFVSQIVYVFSIMVIFLWMGIILLQIANNCREVSDGKMDLLGRMLSSIQMLFILLGIYTIIIFLINLKGFMTSLRFWLRSG